MKELLVSHVCNLLIFVFNGATIMTNKKPQLSAGVFLYTNVILLLQPSLITLRFVWNKVLKSITIFDKPKQCNA